MKLYKLTDQHNHTRGNTQWGEYVIHKARNCANRRLCSDTVLHAYTDPLLAVLLNPVHGNYAPAKLWKAEGEVAVFDPTKVGCIELTTIREIPLPEISIKQKVKFAILCALEVYTEKSFVKWAEDWLSGKDRSFKTDAARAARAAAYDAADARAADARAAKAAINAARAAAYAADDAAAYAADAAKAAAAAADADADADAYDARAAAYAADAAKAADAAAYADAAYAARAARAAAYADAADAYVADAADAAAYAKKDIDLVAIANFVMGVRK